MSDAVSRARHQNYELTDVPLVDERSMHGPPVPSSMVLRFSLALLVILGTYLGAVTVERTFSPHVVGSGSHVGVQESDPWDKMKQELAVRRRLALSRNEPGPDPMVATRTTEFETSLDTPAPETNPLDR